MSPAAPNPSLTKREILAAWGNILTGKVPMLSIEITRECPLTCPGCYAYGDSHLGGETTLRQLNDLRGDALVNGVVDLVRKHKPIHVSLVGRGAARPSQGTQPHSPDSQRHGYFHSGRHQRRDSHSRRVDEAP